MEQKEITINKVFYENLKSLIRIAKESLKNNELQQIEFHKNLKNKTFIDYDLDESSHLSNADWILINSIFISMFSHFEYKLYLYCKSIEKNSNFKVKLENLSGSTLIKYFNYLNLVANLEAVSKKTTSYQNLILFQKVRNILVHNGGLMITDKNKKLDTHELYKFLKNKKVVMAGTFGIIRIVNCEFLEEFYLLCTEVCDKFAIEITKNFR